jgi:hypothetical protein
MRTNINIPRYLQDKVERELEAGERIEWIDMPIPRFFTPASASLFLFSIPWTAFAIFWMFGASGFKIPSFKSGFSLFPLFGIPFVLIGLGMLSSPLWAYRKALKTVYAITNKRAITFIGGRSATIRSYSPGDLQEVYRKEKRDGSGDIIFARRTWRDSDGDRRSEELGFLRIRNPKEIEQMLKKLAEKGAASDSGKLGR